MLSFKEYSTEFDVVLESIHLSDEEIAQLNEVLDTSARIKRRQQLIRNKARLKIGRKIFSKRIAPLDRIKFRSKMRARKLLIKRLYQGRTKQQIPLAQRAIVDAKIQRMRNAVNRIAMKLMRRVRQQDIARKTGQKLPKFNQNTAL